MDVVSAEQLDRLKGEWTDKFVRARTERGELKRFQGRVGKVITVNWNGNALVDFSDGAWYDIPAASDWLEIVPAEEAKGKYDGTVNSAQPIPARQA
jgi:hypothetical protein